MITNYPYGVFTIANLQEEGKYMQFVTVTCKNCGNKMYVLSKCVRDVMYCSIHCLETGTSSTSKV